MSALVPPMSTEIRSGKPAASATSRAPTTPAAGPDRAVWTDCRRTTSAPTTPPLDFMIDSGAAMPRAVIRCSRRAT